MSLSLLQDYIPQDRRAALARGKTLPDHTSGAGLFADISGFTPLTERLTQQLGPRRGIEELMWRINAVYNSIINPVERLGGSVISFAGDAITCWFDETVPQSTTANGQALPPVADRGLPTEDEQAQSHSLRSQMTDSAPSRAVAAAQAMQAAMSAYPDLLLKVTVTTGPARRFAVGDPQIQLLDALAGATVARLATAEHLAHKGEILVDEATIQVSGDALTVNEWRMDAESEQRFAVLALTPPILAYMPIRAAAVEIPQETLRAWVLPTVYAREQSGLGEFLTELRPAVPLFFRFSGIDYDGDKAAGDKLDALIRLVQQVIARYDGTLLQLTIGDKGSYLDACFGAPTAHEDDARRAVRAALALRDIPHELTFLPPVQIGLSRGILRAGTYGGASRRTYGVIGDEVNIAARLMQASAPGEVWVSGHLATGLGDDFVLAPLPPLPLKGKAEPLPVFAVTEAQRRRATRLLEPAYRLPMMGRQQELALISHKLELARRGQGQVIGITAEAGMGKSRLVAEAVRLAQRLGFAGYGGTCESSGANTAYLAWKPIWQALFNVDPTAPARRQLRQLEGEIEDRAPGRGQALPLLAPLLDLQIEDNDFTRPLEPKDRRNALTALLEDCLKAAAHEDPLLIVVEDVHWIDPLSRDLLESLAQATTNSAVCFLLAYRPPDLARLQAPRVEALSNFTKIELAELASADAEQLIRAKLAQLYPERGGGLPKKLAEQLTARAQGNPFFIEELLNYLRDRAIDPWGLTDPANLELPSSLHTLILSRMDQLTETQKATLKVASIIGRLFPFAWLQGYYPALGTPEALKADLRELARLDLTPLDQPEPELAYLFKHIVTQEVAYESLAYATRAQLHEQLAQYLETQMGVAPLPDLLAFHYGRSENVAKQREYFLKAGEAAQAAYANATARDYYDRLLPLLPPRDYEGRWRVLWDRDQVLDLLGDRAAEKANIDDLLQLAAEMDDKGRQAEAAYRQGRYFTNQEDCRAGVRAFEQAIAAAQQAGKRDLELRILAVLPYALLWAGEGEVARRKAEEALALMHEMQDDNDAETALINLATYYASSGDTSQAVQLNRQVLERARRAGLLRQEVRVLGDLGWNYAVLGRYEQARPVLEQALQLYQKLGIRLSMAYALQNLGYVAWRSGDGGMASRLEEQALAEFYIAGGASGHAVTLVYLGYIAEQAGNYAQAGAHLAAARDEFSRIGENSFKTEAQAGQARCALAQGQLEEARQWSEEVWAYLCEHGPELMDSPSRVYLSVADTFDALNMAPESRAAVEAGYAELMSRADKISEPEWRQSFLENVEEHRALIERWKGLDAPVGNC